jgi:hypothetical protein
MLFLSGLDRPALLTITSSAPNVVTAASTTLATWAWSPTSVSRNTAPSPRSAASASPSSVCTSAITTLAPSAMNRSAIPRPMPDAAPVTIATLPVSSPM